MTTSLKSVLDATSDAVTLNPAMAAVQVTADSELVGICKIRVQVGERTITVDQPEAMGGTGAAPNPVQYALAALGSCQATTYRFWSEKLGVQLDELRVDVRGGLDLRGILGVDEAVRAGFDDVTIDVHLSGPETPERYEQLRRAVDEHCPLLDVFANRVPVRTTLAVI